MLKILFINQECSEYGQSFLYDGLRSLGHWVVEFPYNYRLHFNDKVECKVNSCVDGPCSKNIGFGCTNHPAHLCWNPLPPFDSLPDLVVTNNGIGNEAIHRFMAAHKVPIAALDLGDSTNSAYDVWCQVIGQKPDFFFRREYLKGQVGNPLSYSFYEKYSKFNTDLKYTVSFMYRPTNSIRDKFAEAVAKIPNSYVGQLPHKEYIEVLSQSMFSVAVRGAGYDTVRRWEIPCMGAVLCTDNSPIVINNDFEDEKSCIRYDSVDELVTKIKYYLNNLDVYNNLRQNCYNHFSKYHTTTERAREFLKVCGYEQ